jgi:hypothetical protein
VTVRRAADSGADGDGTWIAEQGGRSVAHRVRGEHGLRTGPTAVAVCGRVFLPAALAAPLGPPCPLCTAAAELARGRAPLPRGLRPARRPPTLRAGRTSSVRDRASR